MSHSEASLKWMHKSLGDSQLVQPNRHTAVLDFSPFIDQGCAPSAHMSGSEVRETPSAAFAERCHVWLCPPELPCHRSVLCRRVVLCHHQWGPARRSSGSLVSNLLHRPTAKLMFVFGRGWCWRQGCLVVSCRGVRQIGASHWALCGIWAGHSSVRGGRRGCCCRSGCCS